MNPFSNLVPYIIALPLAGFLFNGLIGLFSRNYRRKKGLIGTISTLVVFIPFIFTFLIWLNTGSSSPAFTVTLFDWVRAGSFSAPVSYHIDQLSLVMMLVVTGIGSIIHLYSMGYMDHDEGYWKFFAYMNLFIFMMLNLVMGDNILLLFLGWEGVGLASYLLIGFWYTDFANAVAAKKAFLYNRVGDFAFLIAIFLLFNAVGSLSFSAIFSHAGDIPHTTLAWIALLMLIGATGKSAQIPLLVWLPDAMAGPTPISALIHAATMVTAGVYLIARLSFVYVLVPEIMMIVAIVGAITALVAATIAITRYDIKKVLAYSTISQLGYMFLALGAGGYSAAIFHLTTHAFFKACLFLSAGSVIHMMEHVERELHKEGKQVHFDAQDMRNMGGLKKKMPSTYLTFWISTLAIAGIPIFSGFFSKDEVLAYAFNAGLGSYAGTIYYILWGVGIATAFLTGFYMFRLATAMFHGTFRLPGRVQGAEDAGRHVHENGWKMTLPLWILGIGSAFAGFFGIPQYWLETFGSHVNINALENWLSRTTATVGDHIPVGTEWFLMCLSAVLAIWGAVYAFRLYKDDKVLASDALWARRLGGLYRFWNRKYNIDEAYEGFIVNPVVRLSDRVLAVFDVRVIDGIVNAVGNITRFSGSVLRYLQTGVIQVYAFMLVIGVIIVLGILIF